MTSHPDPALLLWARLVGRDASTANMLAELAPWLTGGWISEELAPSLLSEVTPTLSLSANDIQILCRCLNAYFETLEDEPVNFSIVPDREIAATAIKQLVADAAASAGLERLHAGFVSELSTFSPKVYVPQELVSDNAFMARLAETAKRCPYFHTLRIRDEHGSVAEIALHRDA